MQELLGPVVLLQRLHGGVTRARIMPLNPDPSDLGACYVWDDGAEQREIGKVEMRS